MIMFSFVEADHRYSAFLPDRDIYLSFVYSDSLDRCFLCMISYHQKGKILFPERLRVYGIRPILHNYRSLPYKRQSSVSELDEEVFSSRAIFGFPWCDNYTSLDKIRSFHSSCKKYYVVIAHNGLSLKEDGEKVLFAFDRYSDSAYLVREDYGKIKILLGSDFKLHNVWCPYLWVEYMDHPICLLSVIGSYREDYSLGADWCHCLLCFLRDGSFQGDLLSSVFGFAHRDEFSRVLYCNSRL